MLHEEEFMSTRLQMSRHGMTHDTQTYKTNFAHSNYLFCIVYLV